MEHPAHALRRSLRLFFALQPDAGARNSLSVLAEHIAGDAAGRAPRASNLHVTIAFLGDVPHERVKEVESIGARCAGDATPFTLVLDRVGLFRDAKIAWIAPTVIPQELLGIFDDLRAALQRAQLRVETRDFHPHVTLARRCRNRLPSVPSPRIEWRVEELTLVSSETKPEGPLYRDVAAWAFGCE